MRKIWKAGRFLVWTRLSPFSCIGYYVLENNLHEKVMQYIYVM